MLRRPSAFLAALLLPLAGAMAQQALPSRPANQIYDDGRLFTPDQTGELEALLTKAKADLGITIDVATYTYISGSNISERAQKLAGAWLGAEPGVIFAFDRGASQPAITVSPGFWQRYPADDITMMVLRSGAQFTQGAPIPDARMLDAIQFAIQEMTKMENARKARQQVFTADDRLFAGIAAATLLFVGAAALFLSRRMRKQREVHTETFTFPEVHVGTRLGAPFGGGTAAEVSGKED